MDERVKAKKQAFNFKLLSYFMKGSWRYLLLGAVFMLLAVLMGYARPFIVSFTVDYVIGGIEETDMPAFLRSWLDASGGRDFIVEHFVLCAVALVVCQLINATAIHFRGRTVGEAAEGTAKRMRDELYRHLQLVPYDYHKHVSTGDLIQRCTSDVNTVRNFIANQMLEIMRTVSMILVAGIVMYSLNLEMAIASTIMLPFLCVASFVYFRGVKRQFTISDEAEGKLSATLQENLTGMRVVRAFGQEASEVEKFTSDNKTFRDETYRLMKMLSTYWGMSDALGYTQIAISLCYGCFMCASGELTLGNLLLFSTYTSMLTWPVRQLGRVLADMGKATVSLGRLDEILSHPVERETGRALTPEIKGEIEFKDVCFGYDTYDDVLKDISFRVTPGQTVAILGSTGSGKSSLVQLLQRLYTCTAGSITIDGIDINDIESAHLRRSIGIVLQEPFLYSRSIMDNIRIINPAASDEEVFNASKVAALHDVVMTFDKGYDTIVGERGVTLSGGQKQRVAIARMLMQKVPILVFDDSMSAVDTETDAAIRDALKANKQDSTMFIISHRITTLCEADNILVLDGGRLVQQGTHDELMAQDGLYRRIAHIQNLLEDELKQEEGGGTDE
ncbi:MAG: ABC transporter ATP-binding protein [Clostridia bacterium]|nr:ABC transporter ATP-binding protein [Clostridia bacterium]